MTHLGGTPRGASAGSPVESRVESRVESSEEGSAGVGRSAVAGVAWSVAQRWVMRLTGFATVAVLTRLLRPEDFGTIAVALSVVPLMYLLSDMGFATYIVQARDADHRTFSTVFWYSTGAGLVLGAGLAGAAPLIGHLLGVPGVTPILEGFVPMIVVVAVGSVPNALLTRRMQFRTLAARSVVAGLTSQVLAVVMALTGFGVWALVAQSVTYQVVAVALAWPATRWLPSFEFSREEFGKVSRFGFHVVGADVVAMLRVWGENAIIVTSLGVTGLGFLTIAQRLVQTAQDLSAAAILPVSTVFFAKLRASSGRLRSGYFAALGMTYTTVVPIMVTLLVGAPVLVPILFGSGWTTSVAPAQAFAVAGIMTVAAMLDQGLLYGHGSPGRWLAYAIVVDVVTLAVTAVLVRWGLVATSIGFACVALGATVARWALVSRLLGTSLRQITRPFLRAMGAVVLSTAGGLLVLELTSGLPGVAALALIGLAVVAVHLASVRVLSAEDFNRFAKLARRAVERTGAIRPRAALTGDPVELVEVDL